MAIAGHGGDERLTLDSPSDYLSLRDVVAFVRRNILKVFAFVAATLALAVWYIVSTPPTFTATARLYIDPEQVRIASDGSNSGGTTSLDAAMVESQVEIVRSEAIALAVIKQHDLINDLELLDSSSLAGTIKSGIKAAIDMLMQSTSTMEARELTEDETLAIVMSRFFGRLGVRRVGQSYLIQVSYRSTDRKKAARLANATASAYIGASLSAKAHAARQGSRWLEQRIVELGDKANETATAVQEFRIANGLVEIGEGRSLDDREIIGTSNELIEAQAAVADAASRLDTIDAMLERGDVAVFVDDAVRSGTIARLRERLVQARAETAVRQGRFGAEGRSALAAQAEVDALEGELREELSRIRQSYAAELEAARRREARIRLSLTEQVHAAGTLAGAKVELAELQAREAGYRRMYSTALERFEASEQKASFPVPDARIVMAATPPVNKSHPKSALLAAMACAFGVISGLGTALMRESLDRRIGSGRATRQLERELGLPVLGIVERAGWLRRAAKLPHYVLDAPRSAFSEAMRSVRASVDLATTSEAPGILAVTSIEGATGRSTIASNLALLYAASGQRTLLIDADRGDTQWTGFPSNGTDLHGRSKEGECAPSPQPRAALPTQSRPAPTAADIDAHLEQSFAEVLDSTRAVIDAELDGGEGLASRASPPAKPGVIDPASVRYPIEFMDVGELIGGRRVLESPGLACLRPHLDWLRSQYDAVILDLPAMRGSSGVRSLASSLDGIILVVRHRRTTIDTLASALTSFGLARGRVLGTIINDVPRGRAYA